jgi:hypothetical protein
MAQEPGPDQSPPPLKSQMARSREYLERDLRGLRYELDFPRKIKRSFQHQTVVWIGAALVVGVILVVLPRARKKVYVKVKGQGKPEGGVVQAGFLLGALKLTATLLKPVVVSYLTKRMSGRGGQPGRSNARW